MKQSEHVRLSLPLSAALMAIFALVFSLTTTRASAPTNNLVLTTLITAPTHSAHLFAWVDNKGEFAIDTVVKKNRRGAVQKLVSATCIDRLGHAAWKMIPNASGTSVKIIGTNGTSIVIKASKLKLTALVSLYVGKQKVCSYTKSLVGTHYFETFASITASVKKLRACGPIVPGYNLPVTAIVDGSLSNLISGTAISVDAKVKAEMNCLALYLAKICAINSSVVRDCFTLPNPSLAIITAGSVNAFGNALATFSGTLVTIRPDFLALVSAHVIEVGGQPCTYNELLALLNCILNGGTPHNLAVLKPLTVLTPVTDNLKDLLAQLFARHCATSTTNGPIITIPGVNVTIPPILGGALDGLLVDVISLTTTNGVQLGLLNGSGVVNAGVNISVPLINTVTESCAVSNIVSVVNGLCITNVVNTISDKLCIGLPLLGH